MLQLAKDIDSREAETGSLPGSPQRGKKATAYKIKKQKVPMLLALDVHSVTLNHQGKFSLA